jgi:SAM-dependent methyltransferase
MDNVINPNENINKIVLSSPTKHVSGYDGRLYRRIEIARGEKGFQASMFTAEQVFHKNMDYAELITFLNHMFGKYFTQYNAWDGEHEHFARVTKKGKVLTSKRKTRGGSRPRVDEHFNRQKNHIISGDENIPILGKVTKLRQINRFLELLRDGTKDLTDETVNIIDFGCGKSYLTFLIHHYFTQIRKVKDVHILGFDLKDEIINECNEIAAAYGYGNLSFKTGDIGSLKDAPNETWNKANSFNIVISLHACDTATDHALGFAAAHKADLIMCVPCCEHELSGQYKSNSLKAVGEFGIVRERFSALMTNVIRAKMLAYMGYKVEVIEFTGFEDTAKNLMIRAKTFLSTAEAAEKRGKNLYEILNIMREFSFRPLIVSLMLLNRIEMGAALNKTEFLLLLENREKIAGIVRDKARDLTERRFGNKIFVRGLIEFTNYCVNDCYYCGIRRGNKGLERKRLFFDEIMECCEEGYGLGLRTFVLQGGEDPFYTDESVCEIVSGIKRRFADCAVTLSIGERGKESYRRFKEAGADRYLLRHETANGEHYAKLHPENMTAAARKRCLADLKEIGFQTGAGFMVGSPYQDLRHIAEDLSFLQEL